MLALAKAEGVALTGEEAAKYFAEWHKEGELSDDELGNVSGGGCGEEETPPDSRFHVGDWVVGQGEMLGTYITKVEWTGLSYRYFGITCYYDVDTGNKYTYDDTFDTESTLNGHTKGIYKYADKFNF